MRTNFTVDYDTRRTVVASVIKAMLKDGDTLAMILEICADTFSDRELFDAEEHVWQAIKALPASERDLPSLR